MEELVEYIKLKHGNDARINLIKVTRKEKNLFARIFWIFTFGASPTIAGLALSSSGNTSMAIVNDEKLVTHLFDVYYTEKIKTIDLENKVVITKYGRYFFK